MGGLEDMDFSKAYIKYRVISKKHSYIDIKDLSLNYDCIIIKEHLRTASVITWARRKYYDPTKDKYYNTVYEGHLKSETVSFTSAAKEIEVSLTNVSPYEIILSIKSSDVSKYILDETKLTSSNSDLEITVLDDNLIYYKGFYSALNWYQYSSGKNYSGLEDMDFSKAYIKYRVI